MNKCTWTTKISAYHDGELPERQRAEVHQHMQHCAACRAELEALAGMTRVLRQWSGPALSEDAKRRIHAAIEQAQFRALERVAGALGAMAASIAVVAVLWSSGGGNTATAAGPTEQWEVAAVQLTAAPAAGELDMAEWVVADLSGGALHVD